ncbi:MAG: isochorismate synthase [Actinomycetota bacterium]
MTISVQALESLPLNLLAHRPHTVWISPDVTFAGFGTKLRLGVGTGPDRIRRAQASLAEWADRHRLEGDAGLAPIAFGSFTFDPESPESVLLVPEVVVAIRGDRAWTVTVDGANTEFLDHPPPGVAASGDRARFAGSSLPDHLWLEAVAEVGRLIAAGEVEKVVLARDYALWSKQPFEPHRVLERLHHRFPNCYTFLIEGLVGASPELLVSRQGSRLRAVTLAGTAPRGATDEEDHLIAKNLLTSEKTLLEHRLAAEEVGTILSSFAADLSHPHQPELLKLANLQHLATPFSGTLSHPRHLLELVDALHPTPAVGGVPTRAALVLITRLEGMERGRYAGPVGWVEPSGDGEFAIALRCAELSGARARLFAGNGLVAGSVPEDELEETRLKLTAMLSALD